MLIGMNFVNECLYSASLPAADLLLSQSCPSKALKSVPASTCFSFSVLHEGQRRSSFDALCGRANGRF